MNENIKEKLKLLPDKPGSYQMLDKYDNVIYVGKAKNLKNRVKSYFTGVHDTKTTKLVENIVDFKYIITKTELEALLLEISLIKKYNPRFNIMLTDDKTYPYIEITDEVHPKIILNRNPKKKTKNLFGPYPNVKDAKETITLLNRLYPLRKCNHIPKKECMYYRIGNCLAPCINDVNGIDYSVHLEKIRAFLTGNNKEIINDLKNKMEEASLKLDFENAVIYRDLINSLTEVVNNKQIIINNVNEADIFNFYHLDQEMVVETFIYRRGVIVKRDNQIFTIYDNPEEEFIKYITNYYQSNILPKTIFLPKGYDYSLIYEQNLDTEIVIPERGVKKQLVDMALENAKETLETRLSFILKEKEPLEELQELLGLDYLKRIEIFDNSNTFGEMPVSGMVVYIHGKKARKEYRKYLVKTVEGIDDYNTMKEIVYRRYLKCVMENLELPNLIVMDGGKGQVSAAIETLESINLNIPVIGLVKNDKHKTEKILYNDNLFTLNKHSKLYRFLLDMQEEVHRFAISFHTSKRDKKSYVSILDDIPGVGKKTKELINKEFKTIENLKNASFEDLTKIGINKNTAENIINKLSGNI